MRSGVSTACLYPLELEKALPALISMKFRLFEVFINTFSELTDEYILGLRQMLDEGEGTVKSVHPFTSGFESFLLFSDYERRFQDGLEFYKRYFHAANLLGAQILVLHGQRGDKHSRITEETYFEHYAHLYSLGKAFGVTVAQENVNLFRSNDPAFILRMKKCLSGECAFVLDIKQAVRGGVDPYDMCDAMGDRIVHVHLNDNKQGADCLLPGFGAMDYGFLKHKLMDYGYTGDLIIEVYRRSFGNLRELEASKHIVDALVRA